MAEHFVAMMVHLVRARRLQGQGRLGQATDHAGRAVELARRGAGLVEVGYSTRELVEATTRRLAPSTRRPAAALPAEALTERELTVLRLLPSGLSQREIAAALFLSRNTVKTHPRHLPHARSHHPQRGRRARRAAGLL